MEPTEAEGEPLVAEPSGHAVTGSQEPLASFLQSVQAMVHEGAGSSSPATGPAIEPQTRRERRAARRAAKADRRHEEKLLRAERKSAGKRKAVRGATGAEIAPAAAVTAVPAAVARPEAAEGQRVPAQAAEPVLETAAVAEATEVVAERRAGRRQRRQQEARAASVSPPDPDEPEDGPEEEDAAVPVEAGLAGITFTAADPVPVRRSRGARRRDRRREAARAVAAAVPTAELVEPATPPPPEPPGTPPAETAPRLSRRERRRERREARALAKADAADPRGADSAPPTARVDEPTESVDRRLETESLAEYLARVESSRLPRRSRRARPRTPLWFRRTVKIGTVVVLVGACATLPWVAPQVPDRLAAILPWNGTTPVRVEDPPVPPPANVVQGPVGVGQLSGPYDGVRLQAAGQPREVVVQRLHVDSQVEPISGQSGSLVPPSDPQVLGWWKEGRPVGAQSGTAVITGHTVHTGGGALDHLDKLVVGDTVRVRTDAGWIRYAVQRTQIYSTEQLARDAKDVFRLGGNGRLVLITCDDWDGHVYRSNAVVVATPVLDEPSAP